MSDAIELEVGARTVRLSSPDRVYFPDHGWTKLDVAQYYMSVGDGIVRALRGRCHPRPTCSTGPRQAWSSRDPGSTHDRGSTDGLCDCRPPTRSRQTWASTRSC